MSIRNASKVLVRHWTLAQNESIKIFALNFHSQCYPCQAGHSKWANIRHIKAQKDGQRASVFTKLARQIRMAVQEGGSPDPALNSTLRSAIDEALRKNMPMGTIQNNIKKSQQNKTALKKHIVQIQHKQKVFLVVVLYTENVTTAKMEMSPIVRKSGGKFVDAPHLFEDIGVIEANINKTKSPGIKFEDQVTEDAIECGAEEVEVIHEEEGSVHFTCNIVQMPTIRKSLENRGYIIANTEHVFIPNNAVELSTEEQKTYDTFLLKLRNLQGVETIYDNVSSL